MISGVPAVAKPGHPVDIEDLYCVETPEVETPEGSMIEFGRVLDTAHHTLCFLERACIRAWFRKYWKTELDKKKS